MTERITLSVPAVHLRLEDDFRRGGIESRLLLPPSPLLMRIAESAGSLLVRMAVLGATGLAAFSRCSPARRSRMRWRQSGRSAAGWRVIGGATPPEPRLPLAQ